MNEMQEMSAVALVRRLKDYCKDPSVLFALFLGAGCSVTSGIPTASKLVKDIWLPKLYAYDDEGMEFNEWLSKKIPEYDDNKPALVYGKVMDMTFPQPFNRQTEIERLCSKALPGFGYGVLSGLISQVNEKFNVVITTNFDNLVADAMYLYSNKHPLVITHESLADFIRPTAKKPLIVKLHGDFHLEPRNTQDEVDNINEKLRSKFINLVQDRGIIFIGYGGNDNGILKMLEELPEDALPYGVFWINGNEPGGEIRPWLEKRNAFWIKQFDFDEFMLIIKQEFDIEDPDRKHINRVFENYFETLEKLGSSIKSQDREVNERKILDKALQSAIEGITDPLGYYLKASSIEEEQPDLAGRIYREGIKKFPDFVPLIGRYALFLEETIRDFNQAEEFYQRAIKLDPEDANNNCNYALFLTRVRRDYDQAEEYYRRIVELKPRHANIINNYANFLQRVRKDFDQAEEYYQQALKLEPESAIYICNFANFIAFKRKDYEKAEKKFLLAIELDPDNGYINGYYANFLTYFQKEYAKADYYYQRAVKLNPKDANIIGNCAGYKLFVGKKEEGLVKLDSAIEMLDLYRYPELSVELWFYTFIYKDKKKRNDALKKLKKNLVEGYRSDYDTLLLNVESAKKENHPDYEWIVKLEKVINQKEDISILNDWQAWREV